MQAYIYLGKVFFLHLYPPRLDNIRNYCNEEEMTAQDKADQEMLWPVNKYVNIFLTEFKEDDAFLGTNIMDYFYRAPDVAGFTPGQVERMRFGIAHSPTLPNNDIYTRSDVDTRFNPDFSIETKIMH